MRPQQISQSNGHFLHLPGKFLESFNSESQLEGDGLHQPMNGKYLSFQFTLPHSFSKVHVAN